MQAVNETDGMTFLAAYLNAAMARDADARARYLALYGVEWAPVGDGTEISDGASTEAGTLAEGTY